MIKQIISKKINLIILINTLILSCNASETNNYTENYFDEKHLIIHQPMVNNDFYQEIAKLYIADNKTENIDIKTYPAQVSSSYDLNFLQYYLPTNTTLKSLTLNDCGLTYTDANYVWEALRYNINFSLEVLDLSHNTFWCQDAYKSLDALGISFGVAMQATSTLRELYLDNTDLGSWAINNVAAAFTINRITSTLSLRVNKIDDFGAMQLGKMLTFNSSLKELDLSYNNITNYGLKALMFGLERNTSLEKLILIGNPISRDDLSLKGLFQRNSLVIL